MRGDVSVVLARTADLVASLLHSRILVVLLVLLGGMTVVRPGPPGSIP